MTKVSILAFLASAAAAFAQGVAAPQPFGAEGRAYPFTMVGRLVFAQGANWYQGSGTVIRPNAVLTAAHTLWDADTGFSTDLLFQRALAGQQSASEQFASRIFIVGGYREKARKLGADDVRTFSEDLGAVLFAAPVADGSYAGWWASSASLQGGTPLALGYGAQLHSGDELLGVVATGGFAPLIGAFSDSHALFFEEGMSGGPVFAADPTHHLYVAGVVVAGAPDFTAGGIRVLDQEAGAFIRTYLK